MRILHVASELAPYAKTGGLGDVLAGLAPALAARGHEVIVALPRYRDGRHAEVGLAKRVRRFPVVLGHTRVDVELLEGPFPGYPRARVWLIDHPESFDRDGLYGPPTGGDFPDNARRFALLGKAALTIADALDVWPDVVHGHDWQGGPAVLYATTPPGDRLHPRRVMTIHNLAFQGLFPASVIDELGFPHDRFTPHGYEFWGHVGLLKAGLTAAQHVTTVSPRYAREIQGSEAGMGLDGLMRSISDRLVGIQNGIDATAWSPEHDPHLPRTYARDSMSGKRHCKAELQRELGLPMRKDLPLIGSIARLTEQKGFDLIARVLPRVLRDGVQYVALGTGDPAIEQSLRQIANEHPDQVHVHVGFDEALAHRIEAGCDLFLMPSRFEPCGLNQLYSQAYGTPPIVRAVGGLDDSVVDFDEHSRSGTGFKFDAYSDVALEHTLRRAVMTFGDTDAFRALQRRGMSQDFSWHGPAGRYERVYRS
jgi:starch synthase